jgi:DNA-binding NarL/FixJ family response regulator
MNDPDVVAAALDSGGKGYVYKQKANTDLLPAIEAVLEGEGFLSLTLCADDESSLPS